MTSKKPHIGIVGAGLSGLTCALELEKKGFTTLIFEKDARIGGRVQTDIVDGFRLDRGFQVLLSSYSVTKAYFKDPYLGFHSFDSGAMMWEKGTPTKLYHPGWHFPKVGLKATHDYIGIRDMAALTKLGMMAMKPSATQLYDPNLTAMELLTHVGVSSDCIDRLLRPFFGGVFLDPELGIHAGYFLKIMRMFMKGKAMLPQAGMQALPDHLQKQIKGKVCLEQNVESVSAHQIETKETSHSFDAVVLATDGASKLCAWKKKPKWFSTTTYYFEVDKPLTQEPLIVLPLLDELPIQNVVFPQNIQASYGPENRVLMSVSLSQSTKVPSAKDVQEVLQAQFGDKVTFVQHLKTYKIKHALPDITHQIPTTKHDDVFVCGDVMKEPSIEGAMQSGALCAQQVERELSS